MKAYYVVPYIQDPYKLRRFPGPFAAKFSFLWMAFQSRYSTTSPLGMIQPLLIRKVRKHHTSMSVHEQHKKYGDFVRLSPEHVSVAHLDSIRVRLFFTPDLLFHK